MKISIDQSKTLESYPYLEVGSKTNGQTNSPEILHKILPIFSGSYEHENSETDLLIVASDLQGIAEHEGTHSLLGEQLPSFLKTLIEIEYPECKKIGVLLCGDLYTSLNKRGSSGDVRTVWKEFNKQFDWVVGVAGNHDTFGTESEKERFITTKNIHLLHHDTIEVDGIKIGGISGIIGRSDKPNRVSEPEFLNGLTKLSKQSLDFLLIHETPDFPKLGNIGNSTIRKHLQNIEKTRVCCGHCHWDESLVELQNGTQVMNIDSKVVLMKIKRS